MKTYIQVSQFNYLEEKIDGRGRKYYNSYHKAPESLTQALEWQAKDKQLVKIITGLADDEVLKQYPFWGSGLYVIEDDIVRFVKGDWDSSG